MSAATGGPLQPPAAPRSPWQRLYAAAHARRRERARTAARRLPRPVISIGNLHWGGSGKTPVTVAVARHLAERGARVAILSRGYRRRSRGALLVSSGEGPRVAVAAAGDEPFLMARALPGVAVLVGERRFEAGALALAELRPPPDLFVLDDGFSHLGLARDLDLLLLPAADPFGGGRLWPGGRLREPLASVRHADAVLLTGLAEPAAGAGSELARALGAHGFTGPGFTVAERTGPVRELAGCALAPGTAVVAVAGIARPERFFAAVERAGLVPVARFAFADHHDYPRSSLDRIERAASELGAAAVVITEKDAPKLDGRLAGRLALLPLAAVPEPAFFVWLDRRLAELRR